MKTIKEEKDNYLNPGIYFWRKYKKCPERQERNFRGPCLNSIWQALSHGWAPSTSVTGILKNNRKAGRDETLMKPLH